MIPIFDNQKLVFHCFITTINSLSLQFFYFNDILIIMKGWYMSDYLDYLNKIRKIKEKVEKCEESTQHLKY